MMHMDEFIPPVRRCNGHSSSATRERSMAQENRTKQYTRKFTIHNYERAAQKAYPALIQLQDSARRSDAFDIIICTKVRVWRLAPSQCSGKPETQC